MSSQLQVATFSSRKKPTQPRPTLAASSKSSSKSSPKLRQLRRFTLFPKLPTELRQVVWKHAIRRPRIVRALKGMRCPGEKLYLFYYLNAGPVPRVLHVNRESRTMGLKDYKPVSRYITYQGYPYQPTKKIYMSLLDTIYFMSTESKTLPPTWQFLATLRIINKQVQLTHFALPIREKAQMMSDGLATPNLMRLSVLETGIEKFMFVADNSKFVSTKEVEKYNFGPCNSLLYSGGQNEMQKFIAQNVWSITDRGQNWVPKHTLDWAKYKETKEDGIWPEVEVVGIRK